MACGPEAELAFHVLIKVSNRQSRAHSQNASIDSVAVNVGGFAVVASHAISLLLKALLESA